MFKCKVCRVTTSNLYNHLLVNQMEPSHAEMLSMTSWQSLGEEICE